MNPIPHPIHSQNDIVMTQDGALDSFHTGAESQRNPDDTEGSVFCPTINLKIGEEGLMIEFNYQWLMI